MVQLRRDKHALGLVNADADAPSANGTNGHGQVVDLNCAGKHRFTTLR
jgi:hypothetical protein